jgi:molybdopterin-guanine dinucleotide biosynthesis protein A
VRVAAAIIAGGRARRLGGIDKGSLRIGGQTILERQLAVLRARFCRILLVAEQAPLDLPDDVQVIHDRVAGQQGPIAGIDAALGALLPDEDGVVCVGADMPFVTGLLLDLVRDAAPDALAVVPRRQGRGEPLLARYARAAAPAFAAALAAGQLKAQDLLARLAVHWLDEPALRIADPDLASFENVNTPEDLARLQRTLAR